MRSDRMDSGVTLLRQRVVEAFRTTFEQAPTLLVAAPGRVNLIGEHTDYNDGYVLPAAIDRHVVLAARPRADGQVRLHAADLGDSSAFKLDCIEHDESHRWSEYGRGVAWALQSAGHELTGMDAAFSGDVPIGSGLSSSAAIEIATAYAFQVLGDLSLDGVERAVLCQKAENQFVGMNCGIMDQYIVSLGQRDHALLIDCRSLDYEAVPIPVGVSLIICDTGKRRGLVDSEYNARRAECERGARILGVPALRDVSPAQLDAHQGELDAIALKRCRHIVSEDQRVLDAVRALGEGDLERVGELMNGSHISLRDDYEVSCDELDAMVEVAWRQEGVLGARMTGAGFGGCTVSLVRNEHAEAFQQRVAQEYAQATGLIPEVYVCRAEQGVRTLG